MKTESYHLQQVNIFLQTLFVWPFFKPRKESRVPRSRGLRGLAGDRNDPGSTYNDLGT